MKLDEIVRTGLSRVESIRVRNALNPILWLSIPAPAIFLTGAWLFRDHLLILGVLVVAAVVPVAAAIGAYFLLLFRSPDRLQSEEYQLRLKEMLMRYRRGRKPETYDKDNQPVQYRNSRAQIGNGEKK